jgi:16S rRNA (guanine1207-N2)-methyltransferase
MTLAGAAGALSPGGLLLVYGAKDEGAGSADGPMGELFAEVGTVGVGGHCRLLMGRRREKLPPFRDTLPAWREIHSLDVPGLPDSWVSYPGVCARGRLDPGTRLLLGALQDREPDMEDGMEILDYGCGSGVVGAFALARFPGVRIHLLDVDAVALEAARENVPQGSFLLRDGLPTGEGVTYDAILTNPPFHRGKAEDAEMIRALIGESPALLSPRGRLILVAQKRLYLEDAFRGAFREVSHLAQGDGFRVWEGRIPS